MRLILSLAIIPFLVLPLRAQPTQYTEYYADVIKVIDGDSIRARVKVWPKLTELTTIRLRGVDTPELRARCDRERRLAIAAKQYVQGLLKPGTTVRIKNIRLGKYAGRIIATVYVKDRGERWVDLGEVLQAANYGRAYKGGKRQSWCY